MSTEKALVYAAAYRKRNKAKISFYMRTYRETHKEELSEYSARYNQSHKEERRIQKVNWQLKNPNWNADYLSKRRSRKLLVVSDIISRAIVWERDKGICGECYTFADINNWHLDHIVPLIKKGTHTYDNVQVTHPSCNLRKGTKQ